MKLKKDKDGKKLISQICEPKIMNIVHFDHTKALFNFLKRVVKSRNIGHYTVLGVQQDHAGECCEL